MKTGIELIAEERAEQIEKHGRTIERDRYENALGQLSEGAKSLLFKNDMSRSYGMPSGWDKEGWKKMASKLYRERLIIAGALLAAEIDRLQVKK